MTTNGKVIGKLRNNWRGRIVTVYETDDPNVVRTVGIPFGAGESEAIECLEPRRAWERTISLFPATAVYD